MKGSSCLGVAVLLLTLACGKPPYPQQLPEVQHQSGAGANVLTFDGPPEIVVLPHQSFFNARQTDEGGAHQGKAITSNPRAASWEPW